MFGVCPRDRTQRKFVLPGRFPFYRAIANPMLLGIDLASGASGRQGAVYFTCCPCPDPSLTHSRFRLISILRSIISNRS